MKCATRFLLSTCLLFGVIGTPIWAFAATISVDTASDENNVDGDCSLREAIQSANTNLAVDNCTAGEVSPTVDAIDLSAIAGLTVTLSLGELGITEEVTINGSAGLRPTISGNNASRVLSISANTTLNDVNVTAGSVTGNGGGILVNGAANLTLNDANLTNNTADGGDGNGGGIYNGTGMLSISGTFAGGGSTLDGNVAEGDAANEGGGAIFNDGGIVTVTDVSITNNLANVGALGNGGGILNAGGTVTVNGGGTSGGNFTGNMSNRAGGGIESSNGTVNLNSVDFVGNTTGINGGGLHVTGADTVTVDGGTFSGNVAGQEGGGLWNSSTGVMTIQNGTVIDDNTANTANDAVDAQGGGGVFNNGGTVIIDGTSAAVEITNNVSNGDGVDDGGGGLFNDGRNNPAVMMITNASIQDNAATVGLGNGGGLMNIEGTVTINGGASGNFTRNMSARAGGGLETTNGKVSLTNVAFADNETGINGGGLHVTGADTVTVDGGTFSGNVAGQEGGGLWNSSTGVMTIRNGTVIDDNTANTANDAADAQGGGGVFNNGGTVIIDGTSAAVEITNNTSNGDGVDDGGGGLFNDGRNNPAVMMITNASIQGNTATVSLGNGGGLLNIEGTVTIIGGASGNFTGNEAARAGGGLETDDGKVNLTDVDFIDNTTGVNGGGLHVTGADTVTVDGGTFSGNLAGQEGGGLWNSSTGVMTIQNGTVIDDNTANTANDAADAQGGGGVFNNGGTLIIDGSSATVHVTNNTSTGAGVDDGGGGIFNDGRNSPAMMTITRANIAGNDATGALGNGGGILNIEGTATLNDVTVSGNTANRAGNGIEDNTGVLFTINTSTVSGNLPGAAPSPNNGGGLHVTGAGTIDINTSTFSENTATSEGGGIWNSATGSIDVSASTVVGNDTDTGGGFHNDGGTFTFDNTILGDNAAVTAGPDCSGTITSNDYNLVENTTDCTVTPQTNDITGQDPDLGLLQDNGGPTFTHLPNYPTSPVIDQGNSTGTDQRGQARMADDGSIANAGNGSDIGSVELNESILPVELTSFEAIVDGEAVQLFWTTSSEANNAGFDVEHRAANSETFEQLVFVEGAGTTQEGQSYSHRVEGLEVGRHVFRLKQIDFDGAFAYGPEVEATIELAEAYRLSAPYPNPFNPQTRFTLAVQRSQDVTVEIYNALGQRVARLHQGQLAGNETHRFTVKAGSLTSGTYLIRAQGETFTAVRRVMLVR